MKKIIEIWENHKTFVIGVLLMLIPILFISFTPNDRYVETSRKCIVEGRYETGLYERKFHVVLTDEKNRHFTLETDAYTYFQASKNSVMYFKLSDQKIDQKDETFIFLLGISIFTGIIMIISHVIIKRFEYKNN